MGTLKSMKLSVSLPEEDVAFLDEYAEETGEKSRSAVASRGDRPPESRQA
ncbi:ribbon-helix-helix domain-containing protein [Nonomuraea dietziae]